MLRLAPILFVALVPACVPPDYVAGAQYGDHGELVVTHCAFDSHGRATGVCHDDVEEPAAHLAPDAIAEDRAHLDAYEEALDRRAPRPAPTADAVERAIARSGVPRLLAMCRAAQAPALRSLRVTIEVRADGTVAAAAPEASAPLADCVDRAMRATTVAPFDGPPVRLDEELALAVY